MTTVTDIKCHIKQFPPVLERLPPLSKIPPFLVLLTRVPPVLEEVFKGYREKLVLVITPSVFDQIECKNSQF